MAGKVHLGPPPLVSQGLVYWLPWGQLPVLSPGRSRAGREVGGGGADQVLSAGTGGSGLAAVTVVGGGRGGSVCGLLCKYPEGYEPTQVRKYKSRDSSIQIHKFFCLCFLSFCIVVANFIILLFHLQPGKMDIVYDCTFYLKINCQVFVRGVGLELWIFSYVTPLTIASPF